MSSGFFDDSAAAVARSLIGVRLTVNGVGGVIVETEAYDSNDPASHSFSGITARNASMFGPPGCAYVYRIYGLHWCLNFVCSAREAGSAVLIRALEPRQGIETMRSRRGAVPDRLLCSGPGRLAQALAVDDALDGASLNDPPFDLIADDQPRMVQVGRRIGISKAASTPWRFVLAGSPFLSRPRRA